jgi:hypothetical protein
VLDIISSLATTVLDIVQTKLGRGEVHKIRIKGKVATVNGLCPQIDDLT